MQTCMAGLSCHSVKEYKCFKIEKHYWKKIKVIFTGIEESIFHENIFWLNTFPRSKHLTIVCYFFFLFEFFMIINFDLTVINFCEKLTSNFFKLNICGSVQKTDTVYFASCRCTYSKINLRHKYIILDYKYRI